MKSVRIAALLHAYPPVHNAGAEWMTHTMLRACVAQGHEVTVTLSNTGDGDYDYQGVAVRPYRSKNDAIAATQNADIVVTHLENTPRATVLARLFHKPIVHILHNTHQPSKQWLAPDIALGVYNSQWMSSDFDSYFRSTGKAAPPTIVIHPPVALDDYTTTPGNKITLINLCDEKGGNLFWDIAGKLPEYEFLAAQGSYGEQVIRDLPNVTVTPQTPGHLMRSNVYTQTKILLMPSFYESWGRVGVEAMASGIPVIAEPTPGLKESLGDAGIFCDRRDINAWVDAIRTLMDGRKYRAASRKAKARAQQLDPTHDLAQWVNALEEIHDGSTRHTRRY